MNKHKKHQRHPGNSEITEKQTVKQDKSYKNYIYGIIIVFTFILYSNTIFNEYALDDAIVITQNEFTKQVVSGIKDILSTELFTGFFGVQKNLVSGGRYRPLSLVTFAIEYEFLGQNPHFSHFINILLYALTCILIFIVLSKLLSKYRAKRWWVSIPFITTILFVAHPIHTEVVASVKGRDEIFTLLGVFLTLLFTLKYLDLKKTKYLVYSFIAFFLALLSKENAITFIAIIPLSVYFFTSHTMKRNLITFIPLLLSTILFSNRCIH